VKRGLNPGGPPSKAKYSSVTDSAPVPRGKGEKNPVEGSEIEPETMRLQAVAARLGGLRHAFCIMSLRVASRRQG